MIAVTTDDGLAELASVRQEVAAAEFRRLRTVLDHLDGLDETGWEFAARVSTVAQALGWSENQVQNRVCEAQTVRDRLPVSWTAFAEGRLDAMRIGELGRQAGKLVHDESFERLDARAAAYGETHTCSELRSWLKRRVAMLEPEHSAERYKDAVAGRSVRVSHSTAATPPLRWLH